MQLPRGGDYSIRGVLYLAQWPAGHPIACGDRAPVRGSRAVLSIPSGGERRHDSWRCCRRPIWRILARAAQASRRPKGLEDARKYSLTRAGSALYSGEALQR